MHDWPQQREPDPSRIYHWSDPRLPQFAFEWHVRTQKVYRVDVPGLWVDGCFVRDGSKLTARGYCIAEHVDTHAWAIGAVQTFCRGYLKAVADWNVKAIGSNAPERIVSPGTDPCPIR